MELCVIPPRETGGLPLTHYELRIQPSPNERFHGPFAYLPGRRVVRLPDLTPNHFYKFALSAVTSAGRGPNTYLQVMTRTIGVPKLRLIATDNDVTSADYLVRWLLESDGGSPVVLYKIRIRPVETYWGPGMGIFLPYFAQKLYLTITPFYFQCPSKSHRLAHGQCLMCFPVMPTV